MQGFVGQREFSVPAALEKQSKSFTGSEIETPVSQEDTKSSLAEIAADKAKELMPQTEKAEKEFLLTLISRRSVKRPGLRYLRRGVDDDGYTANTVESEQILSDPEWSAEGNVHSFLQLRGSMPLYFSQSPYSFKPVPVLKYSPEVNYEAFRKHFSWALSRYGNIQVANLVEKHGNEAIVGDKFQENANKLNNAGGIQGTKIGFEWFDFHAVCRGMQAISISWVM
jgi:SacI homology domain